MGVASGLLDQFSSLFGRAHHALYLDCRDAGARPASAGRSRPGDRGLRLEDSRRLADGMYNRRRAECETVVDLFPGPRSGAAIASSSLRDVSLDELTSTGTSSIRSAASGLATSSTENERVREGANALRAGDLVGFGRLMSASHASSRDDFENSSPALDALVEAAEAPPRIPRRQALGAGWAGCTVNLVRAGQADAFAEAVRTGLRPQAESTPDVHICHAADGRSDGSRMRALP